MGSKGKMPWITFNGVDVDDSQFCIEYLAKNLGKDLSENLNNVEKSIARAFFKLCDESLRWCMIIHRYKYGTPEDALMPWIIFRIIKNKVLKVTAAQGYGLHKKEESEKIFLML